jgi:hypothetical protein
MSVKGSCTLSVSTERDQLRFSIHHKTGCPINLWPVIVVIKEH